MVPEVGLEPTRRPDPRGILSPVRLPIPPLRHQRCAKGLTSALPIIAYLISRDSCGRRKPHDTAKLPWCQEGHLQSLNHFLCHAPQSSRSGRPGFLMRRRALPSILCTEESGKLGAESARSCTEAALAI